MISKNLYSLQNAQPFIFQLICMQLCKCIHCFLKAHNKQLNQYYLNYTTCFTQKKKLVRVGSTRKKKTRVESRSAYFCFGSKKSGSGQVFFGSGQKILTRFAMSTHSTWVGSNYKQLSFNRLSTHLEGPLGQPHPTWVGSNYKQLNIE